MWRQIRLLLGISVFWVALSMVSDGLTTLVVPDYLLGFTGKESRATILGLVTFAGLILGMIVQPVAGSISDRLRGRRGALGAGLLGLLVALAIFGNARSLVLVLVGYLLIQVMTNIAQAVQQSFIPDLVTTEQRGTAAGLKNLMDIGGALLGFIILGQLVGQGDVSPALFAIAIVSLITYVLTIILVRETPIPSAKSMSTPRSLRAVFQIDGQQHPLFMRLVITRFLFLLGTYAVGRFLLYFIADRLHLDRNVAAEKVGMLLASLTFITFIAAPVFGIAADRLGHLSLMVFGAIVSAVGAVLLTTVQSEGAILLFGGMMAIGSAAFTSANWALTTVVIPPQEAARFMGLANVGTAGAAAIAGLFGPLVDTANNAADGAGYVVLFVLAAAAFLSSAGGVWLFDMKRFKGSTEN